MALCWATCMCTGQLCSLPVPILVLHAALRALLPASTVKKGHVAQLLRKKRYSIVTATFKKLFPGGVPLLLLPLLPLLPLLTQRCGATQGS